MKTKTDLKGTDLVTNLLENLLRVTGEIQAVLD
jgi:hypothetical protein